MTAKPFPARVRWLALWRHRWLLLDALNQIAHGDIVAVKIAWGVHYSASAEWSSRFYKAARDVIDIGVHHG